MTRNRFVWMDSVRGLAILLVILGHSVAVPIEHGFSSPSALVAVNAFLAPFRIPTLLFLSGLLLDRSLAKPWMTYLIGKWQFIAWPYLIWVIIRYIPEYRNMSFVDPEVWFAAGYLWFLFFLIGYYLVALATRKLPPSAILLVFFVIVLLPQHSMTDFAFFGLFFFAGHVVSDWDPTLSWTNRKKIIVPAAIWGIVTGLGHVAGLVPMGEVQSLPGVFCGIIAATAAARKVGACRVLCPLQFAGRNSIVFYVAHFPIVSVAVAVMARFLPTAETWFWLCSGILAATICSFLAKFRSVPPVAWLFKSPWPSGVGRATTQCNPKPHQKKR